MDAQRPADSPTVQAHKRQFAWQILVPFLVVTVLVLAAGVLAAAGTATRSWADVSIIWLIIPMLVFALLAVVVLGFLIYGIARLLQVTPKYTRMVQRFVAMGSDWAGRIADGAASPVIWIRQAGAVLKSIFRL